MTHTRALARRLKRPHSDIIATLNRLNCTPEFRRRNIETWEYTRKDGETATAYRLSETGVTAVLAALPTRGMRLARV